jgi:hypothetical protein
MDKDTDKQREHDPGAYIGHEPEFAAETIPGGVQAADERVAAVDSQSSGVGAADKRETAVDAWPEGHREAGATDDDVRQAGENR